MPRNEKQTLTLYGSPTGGNFQLEFSGQTTGNIAYNASAATIQTALEALSNIAPGDVDVTGGSLPGTPVVVEFQGAYAATKVPSLRVLATGLTGGSLCRRDDHHGRRICWSRQRNQSLLDIQ